MMRFRLPFVFLSAFILSGILPLTSRAEEKKLVVSDFTNGHAKLGSNGIPKGWSLKVWQGRPDVKLVGENGHKVLRLRSHKAAVSIYREVKFDLRNFPVLSWRWKVTKLPTNADARDNNRDDQAAGVYILFPRFPTFINSQLIGYVWETSVPEGTILQSKKNPMVHYIVVRSGVDELDKWITEKRNVMDDYRRVYGEAPPKVGGISIMIDADDTRSEAESYFARIEFNKHASANLLPPPNRWAQIILEPARFLLDASFFPQGLTP